MVPLRLYLTERGRAKVELGLARGKQLHDRRRDIAERDARRDVARELADVQRGATADAPADRRLGADDARRWTSSAGSWAYDVRPWGCVDSTGSSCPGARAEVPLRPR